MDDNYSDEPLFGSNISNHDLEGLSINPSEAVTKCVLDVLSRRQENPHLPKINQKTIESGARLIAQRLEVGLFFMRVESYVDEHVAVYVNYLKARFFIDSINKKQVVSDVSFSVHKSNARHSFNPAIFENGIMSFDDSSKKVAQFFDHWFDANDPLPIIELGKNGIKKWVRNSITIDGSFEGVRRTIAKSIQEVLEEMRFEAFGIVYTKRTGREGIAPALIAEMFTELNIYSDDLKTPLRKKIARDLKESENHLFSFRNLTVKMIMVQSDNPHLALLP